MIDIPVTERPSEEELENDRQIQNNIELKDGTVFTEHGLIAENPDYMENTDTEMLGELFEETIINRVQTTTSTAHRLMHYNGKCQDLHGHGISWDIRMKIDVPETDDKMSVDYKVVDEIIDQYDHATILNKDDPLVDADEELGNVVTVPHDPTCEFLSRHVAKQIYELRDNIHRVVLEIQETDKYATTAKYPV